MKVQFANGDLRYLTVDEDRSRRMWSLRQLGESGLTARFHYQADSDGTVTLRGTIGPTVSKCVSEGSIRRKFQLPGGR